MKSGALELRIRKTLQEHLLHAGWKLKIFQRGNVDTKSDYLMKATKGIKEMSYEIDFKSNPEPYRLQHFMKIFGKTHIKEKSKYLLVAPYFTETARALLLKRRIPFMDLSGNCYIQAPDFLIHYRGYPNIFRYEKTVKGLMNKQSKKILETLKSKPNYQWTYRELAKTSGASLGQCFRVIMRLKKENVIHKIRRCIYISDPKTVDNLIRKGLKRKVYGEVTKK